jgi:hypothetical protein
VTDRVINFETGFFINLFLALHSYLPLSDATADLIMRSDLRLNESRDVKVLLAIENSQTHLVWTNSNFVLFLFIDRRSLNHVTLGAGSPFTLHVIFTRLPSLAGSLAKLWNNISMEAFLPAKIIIELYIVCLKGRSRHF